MYEQNRKPPVKLKKKNKNVGEVCINRKTKYHFCETFVAKIGYQSTNVRRIILLVTKLQLEVLLFQVKLSFTEKIGKVFPWRSLFKTRSSQQYKDEFITKEGIGEANEYEGGIVLFMIC